MLQRQLRIQFIKLAAIGFRSNIRLGKPSVYTCKYVPCGRFLTTHPIAIETYCTRLICGFPANCRICTNLHIIGKNKSEVACVRRYLDRAAHVRFCDKKGSVARDMKQKLRFCVWRAIKRFLGRVWGDYEGFCSLGYYAGYKTHRSQVCSAKLVDQSRSFSKTPNRFAN